MSTTRLELTSAAYTEIADVDDPDVFIENQGKHEIMVAFAASAPSEGTPGHILRPGESLPRVAPGKIFVRGESTKVTVVVYSV